MPRHEPGDGAFRSARPAGRTGDRVCSAGFAFWLLDVVACSVSTTLRSDA